MTTLLTTPRLGDLLAAEQGDLDRKRHYFRLDHLGDPDQSLLVIGAAPRGQGARSCRASARAAAAAPGIGETERRVEP